MEGENKDQDRFDLNKLPVNGDNHHPDHQIDSNVDQEDSLKNKKHDVTGGGMTTGSESSSARRKRSRGLPPLPPPPVRNPNPNPNLLLDHIQGSDGVMVPVYYSETMISTRNRENSVFTQDRNSLSVDPYMNLGLNTTIFNSDDKLTGIIVGPIVQKIVSVFETAPMYGGRIGETRAEGKDVSDQQGGSSSKDPKKAAKKRLCVQNDVPFQ